MKRGDVDVGSTCIKNNGVNGIADTVRSKTLLQMASGMANQMLYSFLRPINFM